MNRKYDVKSFDNITKVFVDELQKNPENYFNFGLTY